MSESIAAMEARRGETQFVDLCVQVVGDGLDRDVPLLLNTAELEGEAGT